MSKEISRRDFLKLAGLGTAGFLVSGCAIENRATSTEKTPKPSTGTALLPTELSPTEPALVKTKPTPTKPIKPTPTETKEAKQGILWTRELLFSSKKREAFFTNQDKLFLATPEGYPAAFNLATGEKLWQWEERGIVYGAEPETVYMVRSDKRLYALDAPTGETKWKVVPGVSDRIEVSFPMMIGKQTVHLPLENKGNCLGCSSLLSIDKKTGQTLWWENSQVATYYQGSKSTIMMMGPKDTKGLNPVTGEVKWVLDPINEFSSIFTEDRLFYTPSNAAVGIDLDSGKEVWRATKGTEDRRCYEKVLAVSPTKVYALYSTDQADVEYQYLGAFDRQTGEELWKEPHVTVLSGNEYVPGWNFIGEIEGTTILSNENLGYTRGIDVPKKWRWTNDYLRINRLVGISKNTLIATYNDPDSSPPFLFGLDPATGGRKWRLELSQVTHEAIIFHDKVIYGNGRALTVLDPETGALLSSIPLPDQPTRLVPQKDFLLAQSKGSLSAVLI